MTATSNTTSLVDYDQLLSDLIVRLDWPAFRATWTDYHRDRTAEVKSYHDIIESLLYQAIGLRYFKPAEIEAQLKIVEFLLMAQAEAELTGLVIDWWYLLKLAARRGSLEVVKVLLAAGATIELESLAEAVMNCVNIDNDQAYCLQILIFLINYTSLDLSWLLVYGHDRHTRDNPLLGYDCDEYLRVKIPYLDHSLVTRAILLHGLPSGQSNHNQEKIRSHPAVLHQLDQARAINTITMLVRLGMIDCESIQEYQEITQLHWTFLTVKLVERLLD